MYFNIFSFHFNFKKKSVPIFKKSIRPKLNGIFSGILNLDIKERVKKENLLFFEFHQLLESQNSMFTILTCCMEYYFYKGFYHNKSSKNVRVLPLIFIIDRATQVSWFNIMSHQGYCGDYLSHQIGRHSINAGHYFSPTENNATRRSEQAQQKAVEIKLTEKNKKLEHFWGYKGPNVTKNIPILDVCNLIISFFT